MLEVYLDDVLQDNGDAVTFSDVALDAAKETKALKLTNTGGSAMSVGLFKLGSGFYIIGTLNSISIPAGESKTVTLSTYTANAGQFNRTMSFVADGEAFELDLTLLVTTTEVLYTTRDKMNTRIGKFNIDQWADRDGLEDENLIEATVQSAIRDASIEIDAILSKGVFVVPFTTVPALIERICSERATMCLYKSKAVWVEQWDRVFNTLNKHSITMLESLRTGRMNLVGAENTADHNSPIIGD